MLPYSRVIKGLDSRKVRKKKDCFSSKDRVF